MLRKLALWVFVLLVIVIMTAANPLIGATVAGGIASLVTRVLVIKMHKLVNQALQ
jgi:hypothetical protein